jgi:hypothetical protein
MRKPCCRGVAGNGHGTASAPPIERVFESFCDSMTDVISRNLQEVSAPAVRRQNAHSNR